MLFWRGSSEAWRYIQINSEILITNYKFVISHPEPQIDLVTIPPRDSHGDLFVIITLNKQNITSHLTLSFNINDIARLNCVRPCYSYETPDLYNTWFLKSTQTLALGMIQKYSSTCCNFVAKINLLRQIISLRNDYLVWSENSEIAM